ncbi:hypothetical protein M885DRAFT_510610 [Pelagophyceae sp. CCMP2097]|nr:hypothetical protein M885DRAFT_510610 [Pelagophyceae sp. CCMP2097]
MHSRLDMLSRSLVHSTPPSPCATHRRPALDAREPRSGQGTYCSAATLRRARAPTTVPGSSSPTDPDMSARYTRSLANDCCAAFHRRTRGRTRFARQRPPGTKRSSRRRGFGEARRTGASKTPGPRSTPPSANFWASRLRWWRSGASPTRSRPTARGDSSTRPKTARSAGPPFGQTTARGGASKTFATLARCDDGRRAHRPRRRRRPRATLRRRRGRCSRCSRCSLWSSRPRFAGASRTRTRRRRRRASPTHGRRADCPYKSADVPTLTLDRHRRVQRRRSRPARPEKRRRGPAAPCCVAYSPDGRKCRRRNTSQSQLSDSPDLLRLLFRAARSPRRPSQLFRVVHGAA